MGGFIAAETAISHPSWPMNLVSPAVAGSALRERNDASQVT